MPTLLDVEGFRFWVFSQELVNEHAQDFLARWRQHFSQ